MRAPEIFVPDGSAAMLRGPIRVKVWAHDQGGTLVRGYVLAHDRWLICPPGPDAAQGDEDKPTNTPSPSRSPALPAEQSRRVAGADAPEAEILAERTR
jgi:hypothetical protein